MAVGFSMPEIHTEYGSAKSLVQFRTIATRATMSSNHDASVLSDGHACFSQLKEEKMFRPGTSPTPRAAMQSSIC